MIITIVLKTKAKISNTTLDLVTQFVKNDLTGTTLVMDTRGVCLLGPTNTVFVAHQDGDSLGQAKIIRELSESLLKRTTNVDVIILCNTHLARAQKFMSSGIFIFDADDEERLLLSLSTLRSFGETYRNSARFNAICDKGTFRLFGSAGFDTDDGDKYPEYKHFGGDMWSVSMEGTYNQDKTREYFTEYSNTLVTNSHNGIDGRTKVEDNDSN